MLLSVSRQGTNGRQCYEKIHSYIKWGAALCPIRPRYVKIPFTRDKNCEIFVFYLWVYEFNVIRTRASLWSTRTKHFCVCLTDNYIAGDLLCLSNRNNFPGYTNQDLKKFINEVDTVCLSRPPLGATEILPSQFAKHDKYIEINNRIEWMFLRYRWRPMALYIAPSTRLPRRVFRGIRCLYALSRTIWRILQPTQAMGSVDYGQYYWFADRRQTHRQGQW